MNVILVVKSLACDVPIAYENSGSTSFSELFELLINGPGWNNSILG